MTGPIAPLGVSERRQLLADLNYLNLAELKGWCDAHGVPYRIEVETPDGGRRRTADTDRKPVVLGRVRSYLVSGTRKPATVIPAGIVRPGPPPDDLSPTDRIWYRWYTTSYEPVLDLLRQLTDGRFRNGALARVLIMAHWVGGGAPTFRAFATEWLAADERGTDLVVDEYAYLTDRRRGQAGPDWKAVRVERANRALAALDRLDG